MRPKDGVKVGAFAVRPYTLMKRPQNTMFEQTLLKRPKKDRRESRQVKCPEDSLKSQEYYPARTDSAGAPRPGVRPKDGVKAGAFAVSPLIAPTFAACE